MKTTNVQFLRAVALRTPYAFSETGMTTDANGQITLTPFEAQSIGRNVAILAGVSFLVGIAVNYVTRKR